MSETVRIHQGHLKFSVTYVCQSTSYLNSSLCDIFTDKEICYNLRKCLVFSLPLSRSTYGTNSAYFRVSLIWNNLLSYIKSSRSVCDFKDNMKNFRDIYCGSLICQNDYVDVTICIQFFFLLFLYWVAGLIFISDELCVNIN